MLHWRTIYLPRSPIQGVDSSFLVCNPGNTYHVTSLIPRAPHSVVPSYPKQEASSAGSPAQAHHPVRLHVGPDTLGGSMKRCTRCDIPLGSRPCPNPLCQEPHGQSAGARCPWCRQNAQEPLYESDFIRLHDLQLAGLPTASARVGGVA